mmetsp:Transcript_10970/g.37330  ORF Transcript_10970/g.37330 Transcript_10970/m.37330 type:complete len:224 (-) Transcript_10970:421-1092(-)
MLQPRRTRCKVLSELRAPHLRRHQLPGMLWQRPAAARDRGRDRARIPHAARVARAVHGHGRGGTLLPQPHPRAQHAVPDGAQRVLSPRARGRMRLRGGQRWPVRRRALHAARPSPLRVGVHAGHAAAGQHAASIWRLASHAPCHTARHRAPCYPHACLCPASAQASRTTWVCCSGACRAPRATRTCAAWTASTTTPSEKRAARWACCATIARRAKHSRRRGIT